MGAHQSRSINDEVVIVFLGEANVGRPDIQVDVTTGMELVQSCCCPLQEFWETCFQFIIIIIMLTGGVVLEFYFKKCNSPTLRYSVYSVTFCML